MTKAILLLTSLLTSGITLYSQSAEQIFYFSEKRKIITLKKDNQDSLVITFHDYLKDSGKKTREVKSGENTYRFVITKGTDGKKTQDVSDANGRLAQVDFFNFDITMPDGSKFTYQKKNGKHWSYLKGGQEVIRGEYKRAAGVKVLVITSTGLNVEDAELLQLICLERGTDIVTKSSTGPMILVAIALALLGAATAG